jgi:hypothetical protein
MSTVVTPRARFARLLQVQPHRRGITIFWWTIALLALGIYGAWAVGPYLANELRRLEPWKVAAIFFGDAIAALWFIRFAVARIVLGEPLEDRPAAARSRRTTILFLITMFGGLVVDTGFTIYLHVHEFTAEYDAGQRTTANVIRMETFHGTKGRNWTLHCEWRDGATSKVYRGMLRVHCSLGTFDSEPAIDGMPVDLPGVTASLLAEDHTPATVPIRFDRGWPARAWIEGVASDDNGLFWVSLAVLFVQGVIVGVAALAAWAKAFAPNSPGVFPWWIELCKVLPSGVEIVVIAFIGTLFRVVGA